MFVNTFLPGAGPLVGQPHGPSAHSPLQPFMPQSSSAFWASAAAVASAASSSLPTHSLQDGTNGNKSTHLPRSPHGFFITDMFYNQRMMAMKRPSPQRADVDRLSVKLCREGKSASPDRPRSTSPMLNMMSKRKQEQRDSHNRQHEIYSQKKVCSSELKFGIDRILFKNEDKTNKKNADVADGPMCCTCSPPPQEVRTRAVAVSPPPCPPYLYRVSEVPQVPPTRHHKHPAEYHHQWRTCHPGGAGGHLVHGTNIYRQPEFPGPYSLLGREALSQDHSGRQSQGGQSGSGGKRKRSWSRAVFSHLQRKGLEKRFEVQKYVTKPDRRQLAAMLGLTDAQVKVWFQNRRMKWRHAEEAKRKKEEVQKREQQRERKFESTHDSGENGHRPETHTSDILHNSDSEEEIQIAESCSDT